MQINLRNILYVSIGLGVVCGFTFGILTASYTAIDGITGNRSVVFGLGALESIYSNFGIGGLVASFIPYVLLSSISILLGGVIFRFGRPKTDHGLRKVTTNERDN
jgi:hypothetical protein